MSISQKEQTFIRKQLEQALMVTKPSAICVNESKSKRNTYIPYTRTLDDNLILPIDKSNLSDHYTNKAKKEMRALTSSSTLTYNTFCLISQSLDFYIDGAKYDSFIPENKRHPLNFDKKSQKGKANIDAELISKNKTLMIEMKMFEPYYFSAISTLRRIDKYKDVSYYDHNVFSVEQIIGWINIFTYYENLIREKKITQFDVIQFLKHLLSILNNKDTFNSECQIELWAVTWHSSLSSLDLGIFKYSIMHYDEVTIEQTLKVINHINQFIKEQGYCNIQVFSEDYSSFILRTNINDYKEINNYLKRYI